MDNGVNLIDKKKKDGTADKNNQQKGKIRLLLLNNQRQERGNKRKSYYLENFNGWAPLLSLKQEDWFNFLEKVIYNGSNHK